MKYVNIPYSAFDDGSCGYDVKKAALALNRKGVGKNVFLHYLRELGFLDENNRATPEYKNKCFCDKLSCILANGRISWRVCISDKFIVFLKNDGGFSQIEKKDIKFCLDTYGTPI